MSAPMASNAGIVELVHNAMLATLNSMSGSTSRAALTVLQPHVDALLAEARREGWEHGREAAVEWLRWDGTDMMVADCTTSEICAILSQIPNPHASIPTPLPARMS